MTRKHWFEATSFVWLSVARSLAPAGAASFTRSSLDAFDVSVVSTSDLQTQLFPALSAVTAPIFFEFRRTFLSRASFAQDAT